MPEQESQKSISFPCLKITQPVGDFFVGVISAKDLCEISYFDVRRVLQDERDVERYLGIQRPLNEKRVNELTKYVSFIDAAFPTSIIIAVDAESASYDERSGVMTLSNVIREEDPIFYRHIARVIDGQHRIAGLLEHEGIKFDLNVTVLVGFDIATQAQVFSTVNLEQTKVSKSLAYDLFALATSRSPQKTCHNVAVALDQDKEGPFFQRIKRLGTATEGRYAETITQATFVEALQPYLSRDPRSDRNAILQGENLQRANADELKVMPLRNLFIDAHDVQIAKIIKNYFEAVRARWPSAWNFMGRGLMLNKTNGFRALMRVFRPMYLHLAKPGELLPPAAYEPLFNKVQLEDEDFTIERYVPGTSGEARLRRDLLDLTGLERQ